MRWQRLRHSQRERKRKIHLIKDIDEMPKIQQSQRERERESYREQKMRQIIRPGNRESLPEGWTKMKNQDGYVEKYRERETFNHRQRKA